MNKIIRILTILVVIFISGCKLEPSLKNDFNLTIDDFIMNQFSDDGQKLYTIISPKSNLNKITQIYELDTVKIIFFENDIPEYIVTADSAILNNNILTLDGNVLIEDIDNMGGFIKSNILYWDVNNELITLEGDVKLDDDYINLSSSKAILNQDSDVVKFYNPVKYSYKVSSSNTNFRVSSENAFYDFNSNKMLFSSEGERVRSTLYF